MTDTKPGKLNKQGPVTTIEGGLSFSQGDKFLFNGDQFVHYVAQSPTVVEASANFVMYMSDGGVYEKRTYSNFRNPDGEFRLTDGEPTYQSGKYIGVPPDEYDHAIIGFEQPVTTSQVKFWAHDYIPVEYIRVDYGNDGSNFTNIPTHVGDVTFEFNDALKVYSTESTPQGQYIYTVDLGVNFTAKYWRVRSFIYSLATERVASPVDGEDVALTTTSGLPSTSSSSSRFFVHGHQLSQDIVETQVEYGSVTLNNGYSTIQDVAVSDGNTGTIAKGSSISILEFVYASKDTYSFRSSDPNCFNWMKSYPWSSYPDCWDVSVSQVFDHVNTLAQGFTTSNTAKSLASDIIDLVVYGEIPEYQSGSWTGSEGGPVQAWVHFGYDNSPRTPVTYASISSNTLQSINPTYYSSEDLEPNSYFVYTYSMSLSQVQIQERVGPQLRYWESDGSKSVTNLVNLTDIYDIVYDNSDDVFYVVRFDSDGGTGNPVIWDNFASGAGQYFDINRWSLSGNAFLRDVVSNCLYFITSSGVSYSGDLTSKAYFPGTFTADLNTTVTTFSGSGYFGLSLVDNTNSNQVGSICAVGNWGTVSDRSTVAVSCYDYVNSTDGVVTLANTAFDPYNLLEGASRHTFTYATSSGWYYERENITNPGEYDVTYRFSAVGPYVSEAGLSCVFDDNNVDPSNGSYISFVTEKSTASGINSTDVILKSSYNSSTSIIDFSYNDGSDTTLLQSSFESSVASGDFKVSIVGGNDNFTTISASSLDTSGDTSWSLPCFEVVSLDVDGNRTYVEGVSDAAGSVIASLDVINNPAHVYGDFYGDVSIATTNTNEGDGGSLFVRVDSTIYKYNKTTLPLTSPETGTNAALLASGISMKDSIKHFQYDGYSIGGLSYVYDDSDRDSTFMSIIDAGTLAVSSYEAELDISNYTSPLARDVSDNTTLYTVVDDDVYVINADEDDVAFCNVVSTETILPASSDYTSTVTALVINMFGIPLSNKTVTFAITAGGGSISTASDCTTSSGTATTTFTASSVVGTSLVTATASNDTC